MKIEHKSVAVGGVSEVKDEGDGVITAYVSLTGVEDNVKDIIEPGAYTKTLAKRKPKGVWSHQWTTPTSKTLESKELLPGDPELPTELSDGTPWPKEAGALKIKMQFNLGTKRGQEAYSDVQFFGNDQEWSIGYTVPDGKSFKDAQGRRHIKELDLFEYSAVLFGAMTHARTSSVKDAQIGMKLLHGVSALEIKSLEEAADQYRADHPVDATESDTEFVGDDSDSEAESGTDEDEESFDNDEDYDDDDDDDDDPDAEDDEESEEKSLGRRLATAMSVKELRDAYNAIGNVLSVLDSADTSRYLELGTKALIEAKATGFESITDAVDAIDITLDPSDAKDLRDYASNLDDAISMGDQDAMQESAENLFAVLEKVMDVADENGDDDLSLKTVAMTVADKTAGSKPGTDDEDDNDDEDDWEDEPTTDGGSSAGTEEDDEDDERMKADLRGKKSFAYMAGNGVEYKNGPWAHREYGGVVGGEDLEAKERQRAFIGGLPNEGLLALEYTLTDTNGNMALKAYVAEEIDDRIYIGRLSEEKLAMHGGHAGQQGRGGGRHRQAVEGRTPGGGKNFGETGWQAPPSAKRLKKAVKGIKRPGTAPAKTVKAVRSTKKVVGRLDGGDQTQYKTVDAATRRRAVKTGHAMPDGSFPISDVQSLKSAIKLCGNAKDTDAAKTHIRKRAKEMGKEGMLPDSWKTATIDTTELKSLEDLVTDFS